MGNFYTNVTVRHADPARIAALLQEMGRVAYVSPVERSSVVVFDAATEDQDTAKLTSLARDLTRRHGGVALAVLNHDDDVLCYWLYQAGEELDRYDSWPGFSEGRRGAPQGGNAATLCRACEAAVREPEVRDLLHGPGLGFEVERHGQLVRLLGLPLAAVGTGYEYIAQGELPEGLVEADLRAVGSAPAPAGGHVTDPAVEGVKRRLRALVRPSPALARVIGAEPLPYGDVMGKVHQYLVRHGLFDTSATMPVAVADDALRPVLGADRLPYPQLPFLLERHLTPV